MWSEMVNANLRIGFSFDGSYLVGGCEEGKDRQAHSDGNSMAKYAYLCR